MTKTTITKCMILSSLLLPIVPAISHAADQVAADQVAADQEEPVVKEAKPSQTVETLIQEEHVLFDRRLSLEVGLTYSQFDRKQLALNGFLALDAIFLGNISVDEVEANVLTMDVTGRYGITPRLQVDFNAPFLYRSTTYRSTDVGGDAVEEDITLDPELADVSAGIYYQLLKERPGRPDVVWNLRVKAPTGSDPYGIETHNVTGTGLQNIPDELSSGNGVWAVSTGFSFMKTLDPAILFANLGYFYNVPKSFADISPSAAGDQPGEVNLGNSIQYSLGIAFALNERLSLNMSYAQRFTNESEVTYDGGETTTIVGSDANAATMNFGVTCAMSDHLSMVTNVGAGLTTDAPDVQFAIKFPYNF